MERGGKRKRSHRPLMARDVCRSSRLLKKKGREKKEESPRNLNTHSVPSPVVSYSVGTVAGPSHQRARESLSDTFSYQRSKISTEIGYVR